jgi:hypothetical protein
MRALLLLLISSAAFAEEPRGAFCELTPCVPGTVTRAKLLEDEPAGPVTCAKGSELGRDTQTKKLVFCTVAKAVTVDGIPIAAKSYTLFHPNGKLYQSHASAPFDRTLADGSTVRCAAELFALEPTGTLRYCDLAGPRTGSPKPRVGEGISFHPSGRVAGMTIDEPYQSAGNSFTAGTHLAWDDTGVLRGGWAKDPVTVGALTIDWDFELYPTGKLRIAQLSKAAKIQGHDFPDHAKLQFRSDGTLETAEYISKRGFMIHGEMWTDTRTLTFDKTGKITSDHTEHYQSDVRPPKFRK